MVQVSRLLSALLDVHRRHLFRTPSFQLTKTTPDTQSLMCSHEYQERESRRQPCLVGWRQDSGVVWTKSVCDPWGRRQASKHDPSRTALTTHGKADLTHCWSESKQRTKSRQHHPQVNPQGSPTTRTTCGHIRQAYDTRRQATLAHALFTPGSGDEEPAVNRAPGARRPPSIPIL